MRTDDLITALSANLEPVPPAKPSRSLARAGLIGLAVAGVALAATLGLRPDIGVALPVVLAKAGFSAGLAAFALPLLLRLVKPGRPIGWRLAALGLGLALAFAIAAVALIGEEPGRRLAAWTGGGFPWCIVLIPALAAPAAAAMTHVVRDLAPTRLPQTGAALGGLSGGVGAMVYAMYCPVDSVAFVATWYAVAIALCAALGAILAARFLRW